MLAVGPWKESKDVGTDVDGAVYDDDDDVDDVDDVDVDDADDADDADDDGGGGDGVPGALPSTERLGSGVASNVAVR